MNLEDKKIETVSCTIRDLLERAGFSVSEISTEIMKSDTSGEDILHFRITSGDDCSLLLGRGGENLKSLEHIIRVLSMKKMDEKVLISVDLNDYRKERFNRVVKIAKDTAEKVRATQRAEALIPMPAYERRLIHLELAAHKDLATESVGEDPKRRVVIRPYP